MRRFFLIGSIFILLASACAERDNPAKRKKPAEPNGKSAQKKEPSLPNVTEVALEIVKKDGYYKALEKHRGKVVVVDVWGEF